MPFEVELKHIVPLPGMKQGVEKRLAPEGTLTYAQNVRWDKAGRIAKRGGTELIGTDLPAPGTGGSWIFENYACIDDRVFLYDPNAATWLNQGNDIGRDCPFYPIGRYPAVLNEDGGVFHPSIGIVGGTVVVVHADAATSSASLTVTGFTPDGRKLWQVAEFAGWRPRLVVVGSTLYLVYQTTAGGLAVRTVSANGSLGGVTTLHGASTVTSYDAAPLADSSTDWVLAFHNGGNITVERLSATFVSATRAVTASSPGAIGVAGGSLTNDTIWVGWYDASALKYTALKWDLSGDWAAVGASVVSLSGTVVAVGQPSFLRVDGTNAVIACGFGLFSSAPLSLKNNALKTKLIDKANTSIAPVLTAHGWLPVSKPWPSPASFVGEANGERARYLVRSEEASGLACAILDVQSAAGPSVIGLTLERDAIGDEAHLSPAVLYAPGGDQELFTLAPWLARPTLAALDILRVGGRSLGGGRYAASAARQVHRGPFGTMHYVGGGAGLVELQPVPFSSSRCLPLNGFALLPVIKGDATTGGSLTASTAYTYRATFEHFDTAGQRCRSEPSIPIVVTTDSTNKTARIHGVVPGGTSRPGVTMHLWRSWNGGPSYRVTPDTGAPLCTTAVAQPTGDHVTFNDSTDDATVSTHEELDITAVPNSPPSGARITCMGGGRMFATDWMGRIWVSKLIVAGEPVQFADDEVFQIVPIEAPTGLAELDGTLVIFGASGISLLPIGAGPTDQGQNPYDAPASLPVDAGCVNHRSVLVTNLGVFYQSRKGIMLLPRGFGAPIFVGDDVCEELAARPIILSAARSGDPDGTELVHFLISATEQEENPARILTLDLTLGAWSVDKLASRGVALGTRQNRLAYVLGSAVADAARWVPETDAIWSDADDAAAAQWIEMRLRFAELRPFGIAGWGSFERMVALFEAQGSGSVLDEFALCIQSTLDEGIDVDEQPEAPGWQVGDDLQTSGVAVGKAAYFHREFKRKSGTALELELFDAAPDAEGTFSQGFVFLGLSLELKAEAGLRRVPREMVR